ncbi:MAG: glycosyltransferase family 4 protein [Phycisphaeraceae bacterium]|nr:glycosyltransferase family 4 protein [Phycisphaeraceae bacterium]
MNADRTERNGFGDAVAARTNGAEDRGVVVRALVALVQNESEERGGSEGGGGGGGGGGGDHFAGVPEAVARLMTRAGLAADAVECRRYTEKTVGELGQVAGWTTARDSVSSAGTGEFARVVIVVKDTESPLARYAVRRAGESTARNREGCVRTVLLMDGIVEHRNTFGNPWVEEGFLRPAPVDLVCACGEEDAARLRSWGNAAVATGLPRLDRLVTARGDGLCSRSALPDAQTGKVLVATAKKPAFNDAEWERWRASLEALKRALEAAGMGSRVLWRLTDGLERVIGVRNTEGTLGECLAQSRWVITGVSTLMVEAMLAGRFVGLLHPHAEGELWQRAVWICRGDEALEAGAIGRRLVGPMLAAGDADRRAQVEILRGLWAGGRAEAAEGQSGKAAEGRRAQRRMRTAADEGVNDGTAAENVARVLMELAMGEGKLAGGHAAPVHALAAVARVAEPVAKPAGVKRVVNVVNAEGTPVGGVTSWAVRMARHFASHRELGYDVRTLLVLGSPDVLSTRGFEIDAATMSVCVLDPMCDAKDRVETVRRSIEHLEPDVVLPNYNDACFMAAVQVRSASGGRVKLIDVAHTDVAYYRDLAANYDVWDACVGVSSSCVAWLREIAARGNRPVRRIVYGVPVADRPREVPKAGPLKVCYVGRMVEEQKRIGLLWRVIDGLEAEGDAHGLPGGYELHMIGDGPELSVWAAGLAGRTLRHGRVLIHGRRSMEWVERTLAEMDVSILVSSYEGTSISMLEAMGAGVVPCVTRVSSGVDDWLRNGENGIVVEVDDVAGMALRLAELARDRARGGDVLARMSRLAWETAQRERSLSIAGMCEAYRELLDEVVRRPVWDADGSTVRPKATDAGVRAIDTWRWTKGWQDDPAGADAWTERVLREAGYADLIGPEEAAEMASARATDPAGAGSVAVIVRGVRVAGAERGGQPAPIDPDDVDRWRSMGLGVGVSPAALQNRCAARVWRLVRRLQDEGWSRFAVYGTGKHTQRLLALFERERGYFARWPWVGFIDDGVRKDGTVSRLRGLPIARLEDAERDLGMDCVVLSSDVYEQQMWERTAGLRERGVRVIGLYGAGVTQPTRVVSVGERVGV